MHGPVEVQVQIFVDTTKERAYNELRSAIVLCTDSIEKMERLGN